MQAEMRLERRNKMVSGASIISMSLSPNIVENVVEEPIREDIASEADNSWMELVNWGSP
jgi:hypothetical protein